MFQVLNKVILAPRDDGSGCQQWRFNEVGCNIYTVSSAYTPYGKPERFLAAGRRTRLVQMAAQSVDDYDRLWKLSLPVVPSPEEAL